MRTRFKKTSEKKVRQSVCTFLNRAILGVVGEDKTNPLIQRDLDRIADK